ncbi:helicase-related protein [Micromonospora sp. BRA006-A]|nr:helicase-related protein [Micromonospora sp. BRA006-A]
MLDINLPDVRRGDLREARGLVSRLFTAQEPVAGMSGRVNNRQVQQFRLPGYPLVLICTDLLQEGEDLHTFCSRVYHYGLAWTPSAIEQRIGRVDRVRSESERRLTNLTGSATGDDLLQVYYPHLTDTVERLQVRRVLRRMNDFLRLMHEGLYAAGGRGQPPRRQPGGTHRRRRPTAAGRAAPDLVSRTPRAPKREGSAAGIGRDARHRATRALQRAGARGSA